MSEISFAAPVTAPERMAALDVLRGVALFGVFMANFVGLVSVQVLSTEALQNALPTAPVDAWVKFAVYWLVVDKANTLFAFLFGLGFYLQMQRLTGRGAPFERIYLRRLAILFVFGLFHLVFVFAWDILHLYALCGFVLLAMRRASGRVLLTAGLAMALLGRLVVEQGMGASGLSEALGAASTFSDEAARQRQALAVSGDYLGLVRAVLRFTWLDYFVGATAVGWFLYALGRFLLGAWVGRQGWLQAPERYAPHVRRWAMIALPAGLVGELAVSLLERAQDLGVFATSTLSYVLTETLHMVSVPVLAAGYVCLIVSAVYGAGRRWLAPLADVGRMALTNYVSQSLIMAFVLTGVGPGLGLAGHIGVGAIALIVVAAFVGQVLFSTWWLRRFNYGPLEWVWRALTYGERPAMRRASD